MGYGVHTSSAPHNPNKMLGFISLIRNATNTPVEEQEAVNKIIAFIIPNITHMSNIASLSTEEENIGGNIGEDKKEAIRKQVEINTNTNEYEYSGYIHTQIHILFPYSFNE